MEVTREKLLRRREELIKLKEGILRSSKGSDVNKDGAAGTSAAVRKTEVPQTLSPTFRSSEDSGMNEDGTAGTIAREESGLLLIEAAAVETKIQEVQALSPTFRSTSSNNTSYVNDIHTKVCHDSGSKQDVTDNIETKITHTSMIPQVQALSPTFRSTSSNNTSYVNDIHTKVCHDSDSKQDVTSNIETEITPTSMTRSDNTTDINVCDNSNSILDVTGNSDTEITQQHTPPLQKFRSPNNAVQNMEDTLPLHQHSTNKKHKIVTYSSSDTSNSEVISTSTICFELSHSYFQDSMSDKNVSDKFELYNSNQALEPVKKRPKLDVISNEIVTKLSVPLQEIKTKLMHSTMIRNDNTNKQDFSSLPLTEYIKKYTVEPYSESNANSQKNNKPSADLSDLLNNTGNSDSISLNPKGFSDLSEISNIPYDDPNDQNKVQNLIVTTNVSRDVSTTDKDSFPSVIEDSQESSKAFSSDETSHSVPVQNLNQISTVPKTSSKRNILKRKCKMSPKRNVKRKFTAKNGSTNNTSSGFSDSLDDDNESVYNRKSNKKPAALDSIQDTTDKFIYKKTSPVQKHSSVSENSEKTTLLKDFKATGNSDDKFANLDLSDTKPLETALSSLPKISSVLDINNDNHNDQTAVPNLASVGGVSSDMSVKETHSVSPSIIPDSKNIFTALNQSNETSFDETATSDVPDANTITDLPLNNLSCAYPKPTTDKDKPGTSNEYLLASKSSAKKSGGKKKRNKSTPHFKREFIDFVSDDEQFLHPENLDFSAGSSEVWSEKDHDVSTSTVDSQKKKKIRRKKKTTKAGEESPEKEVMFKKSKPENKRKIIKTRRQRGESYLNSTGKLIEAKQPKDNPCQKEKCARGCFEISEERRQNIFRFFWELDIQRKRDWLTQCSARVPIKRRKTKSEESKRNHTYEYYINEGEGRRKVCQKFILKTLDITQNFLLYTLNNAYEGLSQNEKRTRTAKNKYDENVYDHARNFIKSLPLVPSHYCRKSTNRLYLPEEYKNVSNLFRMYRKTCEQQTIQYLSEKMFKTLFTSEFDNIGFHVPKKDKCKICTKYQNASELTEKDLEIIKNHKEEKEASYERFIYHQNIKTPNNDTVVTSFDLQKVLNTPHGDNMLLYYSRKYTVFNLTTYESSTQNGFCYVWGESDGKRGSKEIGTCLFRYLQTLDDRGIKNVILYCDSCSGQNKNKTILSIVHYFLKISKNTEVVQINFLLPGHSYMPVDSMHSVIEREVRKLIVWSYTQWPTYMESARKRPRPYIVNVLEHQDFIDWDPVTDSVLPKCTKTLKISKIRIATLKKKDLTKLEAKESMKIDAPTREVRLCEKPTKLIRRRIGQQEENHENDKSKGKGKRKGKFKGKGKTKLTLKGKSMAEEEPLNLEVDENGPMEIKPLYKNRLPISDIKYKDLKKLCNEGTIPTRYHADFLNLPHNSTVIDTLPQTDVEDNVTDDENSDDEQF